MEGEMNLAELNRRMVDLRRSEVDWDRSSRKDGRYVFTKKVYLRFDDYKDSATRPEFVYRWVAYDKSDDFRNMNQWAMEYNAEVVQATDPTAEVWPETVVPTAEGHYRYMDLILMRIPLLRWLEKLEADRGRYDKARLALDKKFRAEAASEGAEVTDVDLSKIRSL